MNRIIICLLLFTFLSCKNTKQNTELAINLKTIEDTSEIIKPEYGPLFTATIPNRSSYETGLKIEQGENNTYLLVVDMKLLDGAYYASPFSKKSLDGNFKITIKNENKIELTGTLSETPSTLDAQNGYPLVNSPINWVRDNTKYKQPFELITEKDFKIQGTVEFVLQPRNTEEFIPFTIESKDGKLEIMVDGC